MEDNRYQAFGRPQISKWKVIFSDQSFIIIEKDDLWYNIREDCIVKYGAFFTDLIPAEI